MTTNPDDIYKLPGDPRERMSNFDLNKVDYDWIAKTSNVKELRGAYEALELDGYFPDLQRACGERILELTDDPAFRRRLHGEKKISAAEEKAVTEDLFSFLEEQSKTDSQLRDLGNRDRENQENN